MRRRRRRRPRSRLAMAGGSWSSHSRPPAAACPGSGPPAPAGPASICCAICPSARRARRPGDILVASIHWGGNWGYGIADREVRFAHALIDAAGFDVVHGHSSHHPKAIEIYRERPILYGCGDFLNDYEGISGYQAFRGELALLYAPRLAAATGRLVDFVLSPFRIRRLRLERADAEDRAWLCALLDRESARFATRVLPAEEGALRVRPR